MSTAFCVIFIQLFLAVILGTSAKFISRETRNTVVQQMSQNSEFSSSRQSQHFAERLQDSKRIVSEFKTHLKNVGGRKTCDLCKSVVWLIQTGFYLKEDKVAVALDELCKFLKIEQDDICDGIVKLFKAEVLTMVDRLAFSPSEVCGLLFGPTCAKFYNPYELWNITLPPKSNSSDKPRHHFIDDSPKNTIRVLQISDLHIDFQYTVGANAKCERPLCCRKTSGPVVEAAGRWGTVSNCDIPHWTVENMFQHLAQNDKFDYILWTGDLPSHADWNQTRSNQLFLLDYLTQLLLQYFPDTPVYSALGNHEGIPVNAFPPPYITGKNSVSWLYESLSDSWTHWLPFQTANTIEYGAYYTTIVRPGFRIVSLNMNYCNNENWWMFLNTTDPAEQLQWFIDVLLNAELTGEKVHIIGHIAPGFNDCMKAWSWNYYKIINRFHEVITGQFFGHSHADSIQLFYDEATMTQPISVAHIGPSVTTFKNLNPGYRVYTMDGFHSQSNWSVLEQETYIMNLTDANLPGNVPKWTREYSAREIYGMKSLEPSEWQKLTENMLHNKTLSDLVHQFYYKMPPGLAPCDENCVKNRVCQMRSGRSHDPEICRNLTSWSNHVAWIRANDFC